MNNEQIIQILSSDVKEINSIIESFQNYQNCKIPQIYIDLTISKIKNLYTEVMLLNKQDADFEKLKSFEIKNSSEDVEIEEINENFPFMSDNPAVREKINNNHKHVFEKFLKHLSNTTNKPVDDYLYGKPKSAYEIIAKKREETFLAAQLNYEHIDSIKPAIDLNSKIWFIKELFDGNIDKYNQTLDFVNNCKTLNEAFNFLDENFNWDYDNQTVNDLLIFIYRRFI